QGVMKRSVCSRESPSKRRTPEAFAPLLFTCTDSSEIHDALDERSGSGILGAAPGAEKNEGSERGSVHSTRSAAAVSEKSFPSKAKRRSISAGSSQATNTTPACRARTLK